MEAGSSASALRRSTSASKRRTSSWSSQYPFDTGNVEPAIDEGGDLTQASHVIAAVKASAASAAPRFDQPLPFVNAQCLGVQAGKLSGHRDGEHTMVQLGPLHQGVRLRSTTLASNCAPRASVTSSGATDVGGPGRAGWT